MAITMANNTWADLTRDRVMQDEQARLDRYRAAWCAYHGMYDLPLKVAGNAKGEWNPKRTQRGPVDDNVLVGWAAEIVDTGVAWLFKDDLVFELDGDPEAASNPAEQWVEQVWEANRKMLLLQKLATNGGVCGHAFLKIAPQLEDGRPGNYQAHPEGLRLSVLDPANVRVVVDPDDLDRPTRYILEWTAVDPTDCAEPVMHRQTITASGEAWMIVDYEQREGTSAYTVTRETVWPFTFPPIVDCQNLPVPNEYYGMSDLDDVALRTIRGANARASDVARTLRMHAHPQPVAKRMTPEQASMIHMGIDEIMALPGIDQDLALVEMRGPVDLAFLRWMKEQVREHTRIPEIASGKLDNIGSLSGTALQILFQPLIAKTETKRRTYGHLVNETNRRLLSIAGFGARPTRLRWPDLLPHDPQGEATTALMKQQAGVSVDTTLAEMGYDPDLERDKRSADPQPVNIDAGEPAAGETSDLENLKARSDALGVLIRAGVDPATAARQVGLGDVEFTGVPVSLRLQRSETSGLEDRGAQTP